MTTSIVFLTLLTTRRIYGDYQACCNLNAMQLNLLIIKSLWVIPGSHVKQVDTTDRQFG
jgi:hypothetical protein